jgi:hypothetical protein
MELNEEKHRNFKRISAGRVQDITNKLRLIENLSSSNYDFTEDEIAKMFSEIDRILFAVKASFVKRIERTHKAQQRKE